MTTVYSMPLCGGCEQLKTFLKAIDVDFEERRLTDGESITDLRMAGCYDPITDLQAPILQVGERVFKYDTLFGDGGVLDPEAVKAALG